MKKNIIVFLLLILFIASITWAWSLKQGNTKLEDQVKVLESEKTTLQNKIGKSLLYAKSLDLLFEPVRKQANLPTKQNLSDEEWLSKITEAAKATGDSNLQSNLDNIKKGGNEAQIATVLFMERAVSAIADALK